MVDRSQPRQFPSSLARRAPLYLLLVALILNSGAALMASRVDPPGNDLLLHGTMIAEAAAALREHGWTAFQDPWIADTNGGAALFHHYPHFAHQVVAIVAVVTGLDPWTAMGLGGFLFVLALPLLVYVGGRMLGLSPTTAAFAALVASTMRSLDPYGHTPLNYGFASVGLYGQLWGMALASVAFPAWLAASRPEGSGLARWPAWARVALAALLVGLVVRTSYPAAWVMAIMTGVAVCLAGPVAGLPGRLARFALAGSLAAVLALGFLAPFAADLDILPAVAVEDAWKLESVGAAKVLLSLVGGQYLDGWIASPWTWSLFIVTLWIAWRIGAGREIAHPLPALAVATVFAVLLLFGRATWGDWIGSIPVVGRFHDHRYLLGLHLLAPWLIATGLLRAYADRPRRYGAAPAVGLAILVVVAVSLQLMGVFSDLRTYRQSRPRFDAFAADIEPLVQASDHRTAMGTGDTDHGGTTALAWLRHRGVETAGRPMHDNAPGRDFTVFWDGWLGRPALQRGRPIEAGDLVPLGASRLVIPCDQTLDSLGFPWTFETVLRPGGSRCLLEAPPDPGVRDDVALVRSDLLLQADALALDGFDIAWFQYGLHLGLQYPTIDIRATADPARYVRVGRLEDRDPTLLLDLPTAAPGELGRIEAVDAAEGIAGRRIRVHIDQPAAWLRIGHTWHPHWRAEVDGEPSALLMLAPGMLGLPLNEGAHDVRTWWEPPRWRGPWAALNVVIYVALVAAISFAVIRRRA